MRSDVTDPKIENAALQPVKSNRRSSRQKRNTNKIFDGISILCALPQRWHIDILVFFILISSLVSGWMEFRERLTYYPDIWLGASPSEVRYGFGAPDEIRLQNGQTQWIYKQDNYINEARFGSKNVTETSCVAANGSCPRILGLSTASYENDIWVKIGLPTSEVITDDTKTMIYNDLGLHFQLKKFQISKISLVRDDGSWMIMFGRFLLLSAF